MATGRSFRRSIPLEGAAQTTRVLNSPLLQSYSQEWIIVDKKQSISYASFKRQPYMLNFIKKGAVTLYLKSIGSSSRFPPYTCLGK